ncbi:palmitoyltransferase ZDHHC15B isoform X2 [Agrilus planipennis]|uniref:Palmitoyltransferase n=1 Tax=Agrilus planipennis TaxID=224129 RepID=A0A1W4WSW6_AGRPL|nr:palmitoyltransferase ZDHHC15B isoform X2 [Agrilus planipennis]
MAIPRNDRFNKGPCFWCLKAIKWVPVLFIVTIILWSYYAYVVQLCIFTISSTAERTIYLILYHITFIMFVWAYWQTVFTDISRVPEKFKLPEGELDRLMHANSEEMQRNILETFAQDLPLTNRASNGSVRYCEKCQVIKPDRAHHCSVCGECILKMDHHCPWVNNCVCFSNYKYFMLFLGYSLIYCIYISLTSVQYFISFWQGNLQGMGRFHILFLFFVALMFAVSLVSLFGYHVYLVSKNRTTLEAFRPPIFHHGPDKNGFSLGTYNNFLAVFGENPKTWLIPIKTSMADGCTFPLKHLEEDREQLLRCTPWEDDSLTLHQ